jgi:hypothetical protein
MDGDTIVRDRLFDLRDYFAGQALCGLMALRGLSQPDTLAGVVYDYAEAMVKERERRRPTGHTDQDRIAAIWAELNVLAETNANAAKIVHRYRTGGA